MNIPGTLLPASVLAALALSSCARIFSHGRLPVTPGSTTTVSREITDFRRLDVSDGFEVTIVKGDVEALQVTIPEGYLPYLQTSVDAGTLRIGIDDKVGNHFAPKRALLTMRSLEGIVSSGGSSIVSGDTIRGTDFSVSLSGGSQMRFPLAVGTFNCESSGGSKLNLFGTATISRITHFSGGSELYAFDLASSMTAIGSSGGSLLQVRASNNLNVDASGGSTIYYKGSPRKSYTEISGGARVIDSN
jgi:hypothetical protein